MKVEIEDDKRWQNGRKGEKTREMERNEKTYFKNGEKKEKEKGTEGKVVTREIENDNQKTMDYGEWRVW
jgi:hypothetical protein